MPLSEDISRIVVMFQRIGGWEECEKASCPGHQLKQLLNLWRGKATSQPSMNHKCPVASLGVHDAQNSSAYFKQFYHMCWERPFIYFIEASF